MDDDERLSVDGRNIRVIGLLNADEYYAFTRLCERVDRSQSSLIRHLIRERVEQLDIEALTRSAGTQLPAQKLTT